METFSEKLKQLRKDCNLTQEQVAIKLKIKRSTYANYEQGIREPDFEMLKNICTLFDCTSDYLIGKDEF